MLLTVQSEEKEKGDGDIGNKDGDISHKSCEQTREGTVQTVESDRLPGKPHEHQPRGPVSLVMYLSVKYHPTIA